MSSTASLAFAGSGPHMPELLPSNPAAGECYARVAIPAQFKTSKKRVLVEEGHTSFQVTEPELRARQEQVLVKEASVRYNVRQPTYRSVTDQVMVRPSYERLRVTRPEFQTVTETVGTSKPRLVWKKGNPATLRSQGYIVHSTADAGQGGRGYRSTSEYGRSRSDAQLCGSSCEIWCLVEAPGQTASYDRKVLTAPSRVERVVVPPKFSTITKQVVADRGGVEEIPIPAEYRPITVEDVVRPASVQKVKVPNRYADVDKNKLVAPERYEWRRVVCAPGTRPAARRSAPAAQSYRSSGHYQAQSQGHSQSQGYSQSHGTASGRHHSAAAPRYQSRQSSSVYSYEGRTAPRAYQSYSSYGNSGHAGAASGAYSAGSSGYTRSTTTSDHPMQQAPLRTGKAYYFGTDAPAE